MLKKTTNSQKEGSDKPAMPRQTSQGVSNHIEMAAGTQLARDALAREKYLFLIKVTMSISAALALSVIVNLWLAIRPVETRYFTTDPSGRIAQIQAISRPIQSQEFVLNWVTNALTKAYSMNFANYEQQLNDIKLSFTDEGWLGFKEALDSSGYLTKMLQQKYVTSAVPTQAPVVAQQGLNSKGIYVWRLQIPLLVQYKSASASENQQITVEVIVTRRPETEDPSGLGISQILSQ